MSQNDVAIIFWIKRSAIPVYTSRPSWARQLHLQYFLGLIKMDGCRPKQPQTLQHWPETLRCDKPIGASITHNSYNVSLGPQRFEHRTTRAVISLVACAYRRYNHEDSSTGKTEARYRRRGRSKRAPCTLRDTSYQTRANYACVACWGNRRAA